ncbi:unnamed protein product [Leptosia nina]|uniref:Uncharacterized protein n=1 Tax=Leptosia nina TaxID=320188 RepID=A0AAV1J2E2_9NEOP
MDIDSIFRRREMDLKKISLFLAIIALSRSESENVAKNEILGNDADFDVTPSELVSTAPSRRSLSHSLLTDQCVCIPKPHNAREIADLLNPVPGSYYERLVVYVYRNPATQDVKFYIPSATKQQAFPDIAIEADDVLTQVKTGAFKRVFDSITTVVHSWVTVVNNNPQPPPPHHQTDEHNRFLIDINFINTLGKAKLKGILKYLTLFKNTKQILGTLTGVTLQDKLIQLKRLYPKIFTQFVTKISKFYPVWLNHGSILRFRPGHLKNFPYDINLIPLFKRKAKVINGLLKPPKRVQEIMIYTPKQTVIRELYPEMKIGLNIPFKKWLSIVVKGLNKQLKFASKTIDSATLETFVRSVLQKRGISISGNQMIVSNGNTIASSNIVLRPILIGEAGLVGQVINDGLFKIPSEIVFIEALLVSGGKSKSLGIIPVSNVFVGYQEEVISQTTTVQVIETVTTCEGGHCQTKKVCKNVKGQEEPCKDFSQGRSGKVIPVSRRIVKNIPDTAMLDRSGSKCSPFGCKVKKCKHKHNCEYFFDYPLAETKIETDNVQEVSLPSIFEEPYVLVGRSGKSHHRPAALGEHGKRKLHQVTPFNYNGHVKKATLPRDISWYGNEAEPEEIQSPKYDDDDVPGIRIVGGNAATMSGTPVNNKGRSGYEEYEW